MGQADWFALIFVFVGVCMILGASIVGLLAPGYLIPSAPLILYTIAMVIAMVATVVIPGVYIKKQNQKGE